MPGEARYTAHSFTPTCYCRIVELSARPIDIVALRRIGAGEDISFDYTTTEWELAGGGFVDAATGRWCRGFKHRTQEDKLALLASEVLPRHIMALWLAETIGKDREQR
jgi:SET domain-containing protein